MALWARFYSLYYRRKDMDHCVVLVTVSNEPEAKTIARTLVEERLAACVNIISGLTSIYRWEGNICEDRELLLVIKTQGQKVAELRERIVHLHSYAVPEVIALPIADGSARYLEWLDSCLIAPKGS
jgi:periplasmic divalent cation tolerance protein